ncbi:MAG: hypothetical protein PHG82_02075 [Candidatus Gracilibacteria bacterium]|nr:hypothetical protein [Candidatus Gracilibacteria bacterium]
MSEIMDLFENTGKEKHEKAHKHDENNLVKKHPKNEKQENEIKETKKKKEIPEKIYKEGIKIQKNALKKELIGFIGHTKPNEKCIESESDVIYSKKQDDLIDNGKKNNHTLLDKIEKKIEKPEINIKEVKKEENQDNPKNFDQYIGKTMGEMSIAMGFSAIGLERLIDRESGGDKNAKSPTGAKGIMQLTGAPLQDMESKEIGAANYLHIIKKIPDTAINSIKNKWVKIAFERIKDGDEKVYNREIKEITSRAKNDPYCNFIVGCIHLAKLKEEANPHDIAEKKQVIANLKKVENKGLKEVNQLLIAKNKAPISNKDIDDIINKLHQNPEYYKNFVSYINYNGDNTKQSGIAHKYLYAVAIAKGKDQTT